MIMQAHVLLLFGWLVGLPLDSYSPRAQGENDFHMSIWYIYLLKDALQVVQYTYYFLEMYDALPFMDYFSIFYDSFDLCLYDLK